MRISPKTQAARDAVTSVLVRMGVNEITMAEAEHALWRMINELDADYDEGYNAGFCAAEEEILSNLVHARQVKRSPEVS